ncbi:4938_t:CDS:2 [Funneliformis caledonium]|uniref:4938_t:CDS:1 n=1 Tax=Funneliformis caledonium TaxID=1117310 RepID=A0A9N9DW07_9GLOM|nr:4938_t:CDS:2 [Funneliformis caledonium]
MTSNQVGSYHANENVVRTPARVEIVSTVPIHTRSETPGTIKNIRTLCFLTILDKYGYYNLGSLDSISPMALVPDGKNLA